jgi:NAD(P)H dehydrogenase (quinone)
MAALQKEADSEIHLYAKQIHRADALIWIFPTWNNGLPAILKGYVDRVWKPNVAFRFDHSDNIRFDSLDNLNFFWSLQRMVAVGWRARSASACWQKD